MTIKKQLAKILVASMLLMTFILGQLIVIAHSHKQTYASHQSQSKKSDTDEKCKTCAQNSHAQLFYQQQQDLFTLAVVNVKCYQSPQNKYHSIKLHRCCNKGPPLG
jgi:hypothetical protein